MKGLTGEMISARVGGDLVRRFRRAVLGREIRTGERVTMIAAISQALELWIAANTDKP